MSSPKIVTLVLVIMAALVPVVGLHSAAQDKNSSTVAPIPPEVRELLTQRLATLRLIETHLNARYQAGTATTLEILAASQERLSGELELAASREARLEILRKQVDVARGRERIWQQRQTVGRGGVLDLLRVRASRLSYEIELAREMSAVSKEKK